AIDPLADRREPREIEAAFGRDVRIRIKGDVGDRVTLTDEIAVMREVALHHAQRVVAELADAIEVGASWIRHLRIHRQEACASDIRLVNVLLEEHPLQRLCTFKSIVREQRRALGEIPDDRIRFEQQPPIFKLDSWNASVRKLREELGSPCLALEDVALDSLERNSDLR